jgi:hypothetical protein
VDLGSAVVADEQPLEVVQPGEALDDPTHAAEPGAVLGLASSDLRCDSAAAELAAVLVVVVAAVGGEALGPCSWPADLATHGGTRSRSGISWVTSLRLPPVTVQASGTHSPPGCTHRAPARRGCRRVVRRSHHCSLRSRVRPAPIHLARRRSWLTITTSHRSHTPAGTDLDRANWDSSGTHVASLQNKNPRFTGVLEADEGTRTLDLLHGNVSSVTTGSATCRLSAMADEGTRTLDLLHGNVSSVTTGSATCRLSAMVEPIRAVPLSSRGRR